METLDQKIEKLTAAHDVKLKALIEEASILERFRPLVEGYQG